MNYGLLKAPTRNPVKIRSSPAAVIGDDACKCHFGLIHGKAQAENDGIKTAIIEAFKTADVAMTITEFQTAYPDFAEYSNQKMSALFKQLVDNGTLAKTVVKKKSYFALATDVEEVGENAENAVDNG